VDDDENIFAKSGFNILNDYVKENIINLGNFNLFVKHNKIMEKLNNPPYIEI